MSDPDTCPHCGQQLTIMIPIGHIPIQHFAEHPTQGGPTDG